MTTCESYAVSVVIGGQDRATLLRLVSTIHRRGVDVVDVRFSPLSGDRHAFHAIVTATPRQAATLESSLEGLVDVLEASARPNDHRPLLAAAR